MCQLLITGWLQTSFRLVFFDLIIFFVVKIFFYWLCVLSHSIQITEPSYIPKKTFELLNRFKGEGLQIHYSFTRRAHIHSFSAKMVAVDLIVQNMQDTPLGSITIGDTRLQSGMSLKEMSGVSSLGVGATSNFTIGIDFNDTQQPAKFDIW